MPKTLAFFGTRSAESQGLAALLKPLATGAGFDFRAFFPDETNASLYFNVCLGSEVVVVDATIESGVANDHYANFNAMHIGFDHILIVSRSYLPVNFTTLFRDIAPVYPHPAGHPPGMEADVEKTVWGNTEVVKQIAARLPALNRPAPANNLPELDTNDTKPFFEAYTALMSESIERINAENQKGKRKVFVSYRSRYYTDIEALIEKHKDQYAFMVLAPGSLAYETEVLTRLRRWQLMSTLDRYIERTDEVWVYDTTDYADSWWTQGEMITLAYRKAAGSYCPEIKTIHPGRSVGEDQITPGYAGLPELTKVQVQQIARRYSNSDPLTMGPENVQRIRQMRRISEMPLVGHAFHWLIKKVAESQQTKRGMETYMPVSTMTKGEITEQDVLSQFTDKEFMRKYLRDPVWENKFWENPVLELGKHLQNKEVVIRVDAFIDMSGLNYIEFTPAQLDQLVQSGGFHQEGVFYEVVRAEPRFLWIPNRMGKRPEDNLVAWDTILFRLKNLLR